MDIPLTESPLKVMYSCFQMVPYAGKAINNTLYPSLYPRLSLRVVVNRTRQCVWLQGILGELGFAFDSPIFIWCDIKSEINISKI